MRIKSLEARRGSRILGLALALIIAGSAGGTVAATACDGPRRLCASVDTNTSASRQVAAPSGTVAFARLYGVVFSAPAIADDPAIQPVRPARPPVPPDNPAAPAADSPPRPADAPVIRIALLLPTRSSTLAAAAEALRAGFMASVERDGAGFKVEVVSTGDSPRDVLESYARAAASSDIVVGPMARSAVGALAGGSVSKPTVALSVPEQGGPLPRLMLVAGLSVEDEARQVAEWAAREHPHGRALILTGSAAWAQRAAGAFDARWTQLGHTSQRFALPASGGRVAAPSIEELKERLEIDAPELLFAALDVTELRRVRARIGAAIPCYGGGSVNPGRTPGTGIAELDGLRILDLPWIVQPDHPVVMVYPRPLNTEQPLDMERLYALGIDAFRVARELALRPGAPFNIDGVTGQLSVSAASASASVSTSAQLQRREATAIYRGGQYETLDRGR